VAILPSLTGVTENRILPAPSGVPLNRLADLEEARRVHEAFPETLEITAGWTGIVTTATTTNHVASGVNHTNHQQVVTGTAGNIMENNKIWPYWNMEYTLATTTALTYGTGRWPFDTLAVSTANTITEFTWNAWVNRYDRIKEAGDLAAHVQRYSRRKLSEAELLAALDQEKKLREDAEKRALAAKLAEKRAEDLLRLCLTPQQIEDLEKKSCFYVEVAGKNGKKERYRIDRGSHGNVKQIDEKGSIIRSFCIQPSGVPVGDVLLTQKLWLEASEETREEFWATANITTLMREKDIPSTVPRKERRRYAEAHGLLH
jgi:hypothetical protein